MKVKANGIELSYTIEGTGPWLAMSHSLACNSSMWDEQASLLAQQFKVLRFDTRGHGKSEAPGGAYTLELLADDAKALFDALGARDVHWLGLSLGGMIGQTLALKYPKALKSLALADTTSRYPAEAAPMWAERIKIAQAQGMAPLVEPTLARWFTESYRKTQPERVKPIADAIQSTPVTGYIGCCHAIPKINVTARLGEIKLPALVIVGEQDPGTPVAMAREIHENLAGSQLVVIPSAAHLANIEQPQAFDRALTAFYDRVR
jgi:3-oxoadipate enol-lactonase